MDMVTSQPNRLRGGTTRGVGGEAAPTIPWVLVGENADRHSSSRSMPRGKGGLPPSAAAVALRLLGGEG